MYTPVFKWRQGEYQALYRMKDKEKDGVLPLLMLPHIEFDFEERRPKKSLQDHIDTFLKRFTEKWGTRPAYLDFHPSLFEDNLDNGEELLDYVFTTLYKEACAVIPVIRSPVRDYESFHRIIYQGENGAAIRIGPEDILDGELDSLLDELDTHLHLEPSYIDLLFDLGKPDAFEPVQDFANALALQINNIPKLTEFSSFTLISTSIRLSEIEQPGGLLERKEWKLYKELLNPSYDLKRIPIYGDYTIETPEFAPDIDFRLMAPAAKIVYTIADKWWVVKGKAYKNDTSQMYELSKKIVHSQYFSGSEFSFGDECLLDVAEGRREPGSLSTMKQVGFSHHISFMLKDLANLFDA